ncbi:MAG: alpha/beta hydrolase [Erysipelotrichaceae bacterium]|nr:alpha/beta hydrolase [Erysipelotrichaceae bacterium]
MYQNNYEELKKLVEEDGVIIPVARHRKPDGSMDRELNLNTWNDAVKRFEIMPLWPKGKTPNFDDRDPLQIEPSIIFIPAQNSDKVIGTIIVACGGGFSTRTGCEGFNVAKKFADEGYNTVILTYRLQPYSRKDCMDDMQRAIRLLRNKKEELKISDKVVCMGFSAGGMVSGNCATHFDEGDKENADPIERESCRPDGAVIGYGAFAFAGLPGGIFVDPFADQIRNPFFANKEELIYFSPEVNISRKTPPMFIWQTNSDDPRNSFTLGEALTAMGIPFEMHLFAQGVHGLALADGHNDLGMDIPSVAIWTDMCKIWLDRIFA